MALPTTITGIATDVACVGPFQSSAGNIYFIGANSSSHGKMQCQKATDPTSSFSAVGTDPTTPGTIPWVYYISADQVGDVIHVCSGSADLNATGANYILYHKFDMSTDSWSLTNESIQGPIDTRDSGSAQQNGTSIQVRSNGDLVVLYNGARVASMGNSYARIVCARKVGGTWTTNVAVDAGGTTNGLHPEHVIGSSDRSHFHWTDVAAGTINDRALTSANALQTVQTNTDGGFQSQGVSYNNAGTKKICFSEDGGGAVGSATWHFDSADVPTVTQTANLAGVSQAFCRAFNDGTDVWLVYEKSDGDLYAVKSTDNGATVGAETDIFTATIGNVETNLSRDGNIYTRGSSVVIPYIVNDNGTLKYNEYEVRTTAAPDRRQPPVNSSFAVQRAANY